MWSRVDELVRYLSVCLSQQGPTAANPLLRVRCCGDVDRLLHGWRTAAAAACECGQGHVSAYAGANYIQGGDAEVSCSAWIGSAPAYLASSFTCVADMPHRRRLRSASTEQLDVPTCRRSTVGGRAFPVAGAKCFDVVPEKGPLNGCVCVLLRMACQAMLRRPRRCRCSRTG